MGDFDEVLARMAAEPGFGDQLARDPHRALAGYELSADELRRLADELAPMVERDRRRHRSALRLLLTGDDGPAPENR